VSLAAETSWGWATEVRPMGDIQRKAGWPTANLSRKYIYDCKGAYYTPAPGTFKQRTLRRLESPARCTRGLQARSCGGRHRRWRPCCGKVTTWQAEQRSPMTTSHGPGGGRQKRLAAKLAREGAQQFAAGGCLRGPVEPWQRRVTLRSQGMLWRLTVRPTCGSTHFTRQSPEASACERASRWSPAGPMGPPGGTRCS